MIGVALALIGGWLLILIVVGIASNIVRAIKDALDRD